MTRPLAVTPMFRARFIPSRRWGRPLTAARWALVLAASMAFAGCTTMPNAGTSSSYLIIDSLQAASGATPTKLGGVLESDVVTLVTQTVGGQSEQVPTIYEDPAQVAFRLALKDPGSTTNPTTPSPTNFITVNRYHVQYVRADGRNTPGVDVPYAFDGAMTLTVNGTGATGGFVLVRLQSKEEAPLAQLAFGGGGIAISTIAQVTFYGSDQAGREVTVTGSIGVNFANWGDPQSSGS